jgi:protein TonB
VRLVASFLAAILVTLTLFLFMHSLITGPRPQTEPKVAQAGIRIARVHRLPGENAEAAPALAAPPIASEHRIEPPIETTPGQLFGEPVAPTMPAPSASIPELPEVRPGGRAYMGSYTEPPAEQGSPPSPPDNLAKSARPSRPPALPRKSSTQPVPEEPPSKRPAVKSLPIRRKAAADPAAARERATAHLPQAGGRPGDGPVSAAAAPTGIAEHRASDAQDSTSGASGVTSGWESEEVVALVRTAPQYPRNAARRRKEGWVKIEFTITEAGAVADPRVIESKPRGVFDRAALKAIRGWRFKARTVGGRPVPRRAVQVIEFKLTD